MKIALIGYGKMGHMIEEIARERGHEVVARIDLGDAFDLKNADVAIEFTTPATAKENILRAWALGVPVVCGSTGWDAASLLDEDKRLHAKPMLVWSSNFSVGVNIFFELNKLLAEKMAKQPQYTPSIVETHHIHKLDKPSGTAKTLCNDIMSAATPLNGDLLDSDGHRQSSVLNGEMVKYGKGVKLRDGKDIAVLTIGSIGNAMSEAIEMAKGER